MEAKHASHREVPRRVAVAPLPPPAARSHSRAGRQPNADLDAAQATHSQTTAHQARPHRGRPGTAGRAANLSKRQLPRDPPEAPAQGRPDAPGRFRRALLERGPSPVCSDARDKGVTHGVCGWLCFDDSLTGKRGRSIRGSRSGPPTAGSHRPPLQCLLPQSPSLLGALVTQMLKARY